MAKTTADITLVKGAEAMGKASMPADLSGLDKITEKGNEMQKAFGEKIEAEKTRRKELNDKVKKDAEEVILNSGSLGKGIYDATFSKMEGLQDAYATAVQNGDEKTRLDVLRQVQAHSIFIQDHKDTRFDYAKKIDNNEQSKGIGKENLHAISKIQSQEYEYGENEKGEPIFKFQDTQGKAVEMTQSEYGKLFEPRHYETTTVMGKQIAKMQKGTYIGVDAKNELAQTIDKLDDAGTRAALADDVMGQSFGQMLEADRTVSKEISMALGDDDGIIDDDELKNFIDIVTNPDNKNFNLEISKGIFKDKLFNALENKNVEINTAKADALAKKNAKEEKSWYEKLNMTEKNEYATAKTILDFSNSQNYSGLQGRPTAAGKSAFFKQGSDGKMRLYYNSADPENPIQGDRNNPITLPDDAETRYRLINSFFGTQDRFVNMFTQKAKNKGTTTGTIFKDQNLSSEDVNINPTGSKSNLSRDEQLGLDPQANIKNRENSEESSKEKGALDDI